MKHYASWHSNHLWYRRLLEVGRTKSLSEAKLGITIKMYASLVYVLHCVQKNLRVLDETAICTRKKNYFNAPDILPLSFLLSVNQTKWSVRSTRKTSWLKIFVVLTMLSGCKYKFISIQIFFRLQKNMLYIYVLFVE